MPPKAKKTKIKQKKDATSKQKQKQKQNINIKINVNSKNKTKRIIAQKDKKEKPTLPSTQDRVIYVNQQPAYQQTQQQQNTNKNVFSDETIDMIIRELKNPKSFNVKKLNLSNQSVTNNSFIPSARDDSTDESSSFFTENESELTGLNSSENFNKIIKKNKNNSLNDVVYFDDESTNAQTQIKNANEPNEIIYLDNFNNYRRRNPLYLENVDTFSRPLYIENSDAFSRPLYLENGDLTTFYLENGEFSPFIRELMKPRGIINVQPEDVYVDMKDETKKSRKPRTSRGKFTMNERLEMDQLKVDLFNYEKDPFANSEQIKNVKNRINELENIKYERFINKNKDRNLEKVIEEKKQPDDPTEKMLDSIFSKDLKPDVREKTKLDYDANDDITDDYYESSQSNNLPSIEYEYEPEFARDYDDDGISAITDYSPPIITRKKIVVRQYDEFDE